MSNAPAPTKPQPCCKLAISSVNDEARNILFSTSPEVAKELTEFGFVELDKELKFPYRLKVDIRYDFNEVLNYMKSLG